MKTKLFIMTSMMLMLAACSNSKDEPIEIQGEPISATLGTRLNENPYYWYKNGLGESEKVYLSYVEDRSFVMFYEKDKESIFSNLSKNKIDCSGIKVSEYDANTNWLETGKAIDEANDCYWMEVDANPQVLLEIIPEAFYIVPLVMNGTNKPFYLTNSLYVSYSGSMSSLEEILKDYNVGILGRIELLNTYVLWCTKDSKGNALEIANMLHDIDVFLYTEPCFATFENAGA